MAVEQVYHLDGGSEACVAVAARCCSTRPRKERCGWCRQQQSSSSRARALRWRWRERCIRNAWAATRAAWRRGVGVGAAATDQQAGSQQAGKITHSGGCWQLHGWLLDARQGPPARRHVIGDRRAPPLPSRSAANFPIIVAGDAKKWGFFCLIIDPASVRHRPRFFGEKARLQPYSATLGRYGGGKARAGGQGVTGRRGPDWALAALAGPGRAAGERGRR
jgi:hypothetical protein